MRIIFIFFFTLIFQVTSFGQSALLKESLEKDLDAYRDSIRMLHVNPFTKISWKEFSKEIDLLKNESSSLNEDELMVGLLRTNAKIGDEHTTIDYRDKTVFPIHVYWFEEGIFIIAADTEYRDIIAAKIIDLNNFSIESVTKKISELIPGNASQVKKSIPDYLASPRILHGLNISNQKDHCTFTLVKQNGDTIKRMVKSTEPQYINLDTPRLGEKFLRNQSRENYWYRFDSLTTSLYFQYSRCIPDKRKPFIVFEKELFDVLETSGAKRLIIDLRYNGGGSSQLLNSFIEKLWSTGVRRHRELFVLIGRRTFSSAVLNAYDLKVKDDAILVGEETGGSINHFGQVNFFELPNSKIKVGYSTKYILKDKTLLGSLKPDHSFPMKFPDFINGLDPSLDFAKTH